MAPAIPTTADPKMKKAYEQVKDRLKGYAGTGKGKGGRTALAQEFFTALSDSMAAIEIDNIALEDVPVGSNEEANKEILKVGEIPNFSFQPIRTFLVCNIFNINAAKYSTSLVFFLLHLPLLPVYNKNIISKERVVLSSICFSLPLHMPFQTFH